MTAFFTNRRLVFINHTPPDSGDVSSLRMTKFAAAFADRGAQVLLLTGPAAGDAVSLADAEKRLRDSSPGTLTHLPCALKNAAWTSKARTGQLPAPIRQAVIAWNYALGGGVFPDWRNGAGRYLPLIAAVFSPEIVVGTFGNTDTWSIAQALAGRCNVPWIADLKDNWGAFLPAGLAKSVARRFANAAHMTVYSQAHLAEAERWFAGEKTIVYSGFDHLVPPDSGPVVEPDNVSLTGSIYDGSATRLLLQGLSEWQKSRDHAVGLRYAGHDGERVAALAATHTPDIAVDNLGNLPPDGLALLLRGSMANAYAANPASLFQQKPLELLAAGRPALAIPGEGAESHDIARTIGGQLFDTASPSAISATLSKIATGPAPVLDQDALNAYTWARQADILSGVVESVLEGSA